jgi:hypothetical protein
MSALWEGGPAATVLCCVWPRVCSGSLQQASVIDAWLQNGQEGERGEGALVMAAARHGASAAGTRKPHVGRERIKLDSRPERT